MNAAPHPFVGRPAVVSAILGPILFIGGTAVVGASWPAYRPAAQTISELAAGDAPTRAAMTVVFVIAALCHVLTGLFARGVGPAGRAALVLAGVASLAVAAFPLPTVASTSVPHRVSAIVGFILLAAWPLLGMRMSRSFPAVVRPLGATVSTLLLTAVCVWFLVVWTSPQTGTIGLVERIAADSESLWPGVVVVWLLLSTRRLSTRRPAAQEPSPKALRRSPR
ncbi:MAG: DUF998 domain-containing protein [Actinomycetota bacterium]|nr:DUF998 domain-containing protein [Actinomycetota bacterium]